MISEIGSEFWSIESGESVEKLFPSGTKWFMSGRNALKACLEDALEKYNIKTAELPSWCCDSVITPFIKAGIEIKFYPVFFEKGKFVMQPSFQKDIVLIMDYFGYDCGSEHILKDNKKSIVIRDLTHSILIKEYSDADYYFGSTRKITGVWTGGYAWTKHDSFNFSTQKSLNEEYISLRKMAMRQKAEYILGNTKDKEYLHLFSQAEEILESDDQVYAACERDINACLLMDWGTIRKKRRRNAQYLLQKLNCNFIFQDIGENDCPLFVPILLKERDLFRKYMISNSVYLPVHWPISDYHDVSAKARPLYTHSISLICDQRYDEQQMERIIFLIDAWNKQCGKVKGEYDE